MNNLNVTIIQSDIYWENITANLAAFEEKIWKIKIPTDLIVLPEMFTTGFTMNVDFAEPMNMNTFKWMKQLSSQTGAVITGSYIIKEKQKYFNRLIWMQPDGEYLFYDKKHLYRNSDEHLHFIAGNEKKIVTWKDWKFCPFICYDLRFPIWSRNISKNNNQPIYDCLIYVANWPSPRHIAWETLLKARAIENLSYCVGVNRIGTDEKGLEYIGGSAVIDYKGNTMVDAESKDCIQSIILNKEELNDFRQKFPFYLDADNDKI